MSNYTAAEADLIIGNAFTQSPGEGWIVSEEFHTGITEQDENGEDFVNFRGWRYSCVDGAGYSFEFLLTSTLQNANESVRRDAAKIRIQSIKKSY